MLGETPVFESGGPFEALEKQVPVIFTLNTERDSLPHNRQAEAEAYERGWRACERIYAPQLVAAMEAVERKQATLDEWRGRVTELNANEMTARQRYQFARGSVLGGDKEKAVWVQAQAALEEGRAELSAAVEELTESQRALDAIREARRPRA